MKSAVYVDTPICICSVTDG